MDSLFISFLNMSINASWLILAVILFRIIFKRAPGQLRLVMWLFVALRLVCPFSFESVLSLIPSAKTVPTDIGMSFTPSISSGIPVVDSVVNPLFEIPDPSYSINPLQVFSTVAAYIWIFVFVSILLYGFVSYIRLKIKLRYAIKKEANIFQSDNISTPFVLGFIKPRIYLPFNISEEYIPIVVAHERSHISHLDHILKVIAFFITALHWFNPLVWVMYFLFCADVELACDARVVSKLTDDQRKDYASALMECGVGKTRIAACPVAFGETDIKTRIKNVVAYKKPAVFAVIISVVICIFVAVCFLTVPKPKEITASNSEITWQYSPMNSATFHYYMPLDFDMDFETIEVTCDKGKLVDRDVPYPSKAVSGKTLIYANDRNVYWTPIDEEFRAGETAAVCFSVKHAAGDIISGEIYVTALTDLIKSKQTFSVRLSCDDMNIKQGNSGAVITLADKSNDIGVTYSSYTPDYSRVDGIKEGKVEKFITFSENAFPTLSSVIYLPIVKITSTAELESFIDETSPYFDLYSKPDGDKSFIENMKKYDEESFYEHNTLYIVYLSEASGSTRHSISSLTVSNGYMVLDIFSKHQETGTDDVADWFISFALPSEYADTVENYRVFNSSDDASDFDDQNVTLSFDATVLSVTDNFILVRPDEDEAEINSSDMIYVSTDVMSSNPVPDLKEGDRVNIVYNGVILESYPAQINGTVSIFKIE